jgi:hypothetical protein
MSELITLRRAKARERQIKCRLKKIPLDSSPISAAAIPVPNLIKKGCCDACGFKHRLHMSCVCVRCHSSHPDSDCPSPESISQVNRTTSGRCVLCGFRHADELRCPPVSSFEFYCIGHSSLTDLPQNNICIMCSALHDSDTACVCVRCHSLHPDSDCPSKKFRSQVAKHFCIISGRCVLCGCHHADEFPCPPVHSFEFYYSGQDDLAEPPQHNICIMCSAQHHGDTPCLCVRCHTRHPDADCPIALELSAAQQPSLIVLCRICSLRHPRHLPCRCVICHSRHPNGDCPRAPVSQRCHTSVTGAIRSLALTINVDNAIAHSCGSMSIVCPYCRSRSWKQERLKCCNDGQIDLPQLNVVPAELSDLILSSHVRSNFRIYNSVMALASVGHSNKSVVGGTFVLGGSAYHRIGSLIPGATCIAAAYASIILDLQDHSQHINLLKFIY